MIEKRPDSALVLLDSISDPQNMSESEQAEYALLLTQARDKKYITHTSDSLIRIAVNYYQGRNDRVHKAKSYFYLGSVYRDLKNSPAAIEAFLKALEAMPAKGEERLSALIYHNLAEQYKSQDFYDKAMDMNRKAYRICVERNDSADMIYPLRDIASLFLLQKQPDSALWYYDRAFTLARLQADSTWISTLLGDISLAYEVLGDYEKADRYITKSMNYIREHESLLLCYLQKGRILSHSGKLDSARYYFQRSTHGSGIYLRASSYLGLYDLSKKTGDYRKAIEFNDSFAVLRDSITLSKRRAEIVKLMNEHAVEIRTRELEAKKEKEKYFIILTFLFLIGCCIGGAIVFARRKERRILKLHEELRLNRTRVIRMSENLNDNPGNVQNEADDMRFMKDLFEKNMQLCIRLFKEKDIYRRICAIEKQLGERKNVSFSVADREIIINSICEVFPNVIIDLKKLYGLTTDDSYFCILILLGFSKNTIITCMMVSDSTFRTRKSRIKKKLNGELDL